MHTFHCGAACCINGKGGLGGVEPLAGNLQAAGQGLAGARSGPAAVIGLDAEAAQHLPAHQGGQGTRPVWWELSHHRCSLIQLQPVYKTLRSRRPHVSCTSFRKARRMHTAIFSTNVHTDAVACRLSVKVSGAELMTVAHSDQACFSTLADTMDAGHHLQAQRQSPQGMGMWSRREHLLLEGVARAQVQGDGRSRPQLDRLRHRCEALQPYAQVHHRSQGRRLC